MVKKKQVKQNGWVQNLVDGSFVDVNRGCVYDAESGMYIPIDSLFDDYDDDELNKMDLR